VANDDDADGSQRAATAATDSAPGQLESAGNWWWAVKGLGPLVSDDPERAQTEEVEYLGLAAALWPARTRLRPIGSTCGC
jgi:hypothetical protein